jgi:hypothetical protein
MNYCENKDRESDEAKLRYYLDNIKEETFEIVDNRNIPLNSSKVKIANFKDNFMRTQMEYNGSGTIKPFKVITVEENIESKIIKRE